MASQKLFIDIVARDKATKALGGLRGGLAKLRGAVFNLQNAFIGLGAGLVIRNLVNTGKELENLQVRLKFLLKDTNEGAKAFENMTKFASKVPFSLEEIQSGSGILATVTDNAKDLQNMLEITGNVAAVTGLDFRTAAEQIQRSFSAGIGAADLFREKGVRNMLGFKAGATVSIEDTVKAYNVAVDSTGLRSGAIEHQAKEQNIRIREKGDYDLAKAGQQALIEGVASPLFGIGLNVTGKGIKKGVTKAGEVSYDLTKNALNSRVAKELGNTTIVKRVGNNKLTRGIKKANRYYDGCIKLQIHDIPISKKGILTAVKNLK